MAEKRLSVKQYKNGLLQGDRAILGRAITLIESSLASDEKLAAEVISEILPSTGNSYRIGISGIPGAGKSTFIEALGKYLTGLQKKVAVLAIDPSSTLSGGSILGDKTRMNELSRSPLAFIRPSPSNTTPGGVAGKTYETILLCEAAGFEYILIETVGVGQSETAVFNLADFFLLLMIPGMGDELQAMKKGAMELTDAVLINKADGKNKEAALQAATEIRQALKLSASHTQPYVMTCSAKHNEGITEIAHCLEEFRKTAQACGDWEQKRSENSVQNLFSTVNYHLLKDFYETASIQRKIKTIENEVAKGKITPHTAAIKLLKNYKTKK